MGILIILRLACLKSRSRGPAFVWAETLRKKEEIPMNGKRQVGKDHLGGSCHLFPRQIQGRVLKEGLSIE